MRTVAMQIGSSLLLTTDSDPMIAILTAVSA